jgi:hypothetical protein
MKKLLSEASLFCLLSAVALLIPTASLAQDSVYYSRKSGVLQIGLIEPSYSFVIESPKSGKKLYMNFDGDTLKVWGTLLPDSAAIVFIDYCVEMYSKRIHELRAEIRELRQRAAIKENSNGR